MLLTLEHFFGAFIVAHFFASISCANDHFAFNIDFDYDIGIDEENDIFQPHQNIQILNPHNDGVMTREENYRVYVNEIFDNGVSNLDVIPYLRELWNNFEYELFDDAVNKVFVGQIVVDDDFIAMFEEFLSFQDGSEYILSLLKSLNSQKLWDIIFNFEEFVPNYQIFKHFKDNYEIAIKDLNIYLIEMSQFKTDPESAKALEFIQKWKNDL